MLWLIVAVALLLWLLWTISSWGRIQLPPNGRLPAHLEHFVKNSLAGCPSVLDVHMHCGGMQPSITGCCIHPDSWSWMNCIKTRMFSAGLGISDFSNSDAEIVRSLIGQLRVANQFVRYRGMLLAFDATYNEKGFRDTQRTTLEAPTNYVQSVCDANKDLLLPCCSVHPYRKDALEALVRHRSNGMRMVKWLPNSQHIDADSPMCQKFYEKMKELNMVLLCHVGEEHSLTTGGVIQSFGDPRKLRRALNAGVKVIMAHCASEGFTAEGVSNFQTFVDMMLEPQYEGLLFGDVSATPAFLRTRYLKQLRKHPKIHSRLFYGSDYPVPAIPLVPLTIVHWWYGLITLRERRLLNELYRYNVLLFNLVLLKIAFGAAGERGSGSGFLDIPSIPLHDKLETAKK